MLIKKNWEEKRTKKKEDISVCKFEKSINLNMDGLSNIWL
jgi:hypothetical protein